MQHTVKICRKCKNINRYGAKFCIHCGENFTGYKLDKVEKKVPEDQKEVTPPSSLPTNVLALVPQEKARLVGKDKRFQVEELIFTDKSGSVFKAKDIYTGRKVIFKEDIEYPGEEEELIFSRNNFIQASIRMKKISHKGIPPLIEAYYAREHYCVIMDYVNGRSLAQTIKSQNGMVIQIQFAIKLFTALCNLVEFLHKQDPPFFHLNIKATKVMIIEPGIVNLIPWVPRPGKYGGLLGSRGYASPEQYRGEFDVRSDIYGLGALLHHILTAKDPEREAPFHFLPLSIFRPDISGEMESALRKSLDLNPENRYQTVDSFRKAIMNAAKKFFE